MSWVSHLRRPRVLDTMLDGMSAKGEAARFEASFRSKTLPLESAILWRPAGVGPPISFGEQYPVFVHQKPLQQIVQHVRSDPSKTLLGILLGDTCECPVHGVRYVIVNQALRVSREVRGDDTSELLAKLAPWLKAKLGGGVPRLIGWYHSHPDGTLELSGDDEVTQSTYFAEPWQVGLILGAHAEEPAGVWFRATPDEDARAVQLPFYELVAPSAIDKAGRKRSAVQWVNFKRCKAVAPPRHEPAAPEDTRPGSAGDRATRPSQSVALASGTALTRAAFPLVPEAPLPAAPMRNSVLLIPPEGGKVNWRGYGDRQWLRGALGAAMTSAVIGLGWAMGVVHFGKTAPSSGDGASSVATAAPAGGQALALLDQLGDSLTAVVQTYQERHQGFVSGQVGCRSLGQSLVAVEDAWMAYNVRGAPEDIDLDAGRAARDQSMYAQVNAVESDFDRSGCDRP